MKTFISKLFILLFLTSCNSTTLAVIETNNNFKRIIIANKPPSEVRDTLLLTSLNSYDVRDVSISPQGIYSVISLTKLGINYKTKVEIYSSIDGNQIKSWDSNEIKTLIENKGNVEYPSTMKTFITSAIRWKDDSKLILDVQPARGSGMENTPSEVTMVYDLSNNTVESINFYDRGDDSPVSSGNFNKKNVYTFQVNNGQLIIDGNNVQFVPGPVLKADITTLKK